MICEKCDERYEILILFCEKLTFAFLMKFILNWLELWSFSGPMKQATQVNSTE